MKGLLILFVFICFLSAALIKFQSKLKDSEIITTYVMGDMLFMQGTRYWNAQGTIDEQFKTSAETKQFHEATTLLVLEKTLGVLDSLKIIADSCDQRKAD